MRPYWTGREDDEARLSDKPVIPFRSPCFRASDTSKSVVNPNACQGGADLWYT